MLYVSTPAQGANIADLGSWLSLNPQLRDMRPADLNSFLQSLENQWQNLVRDRGAEVFPLSFCAYETKPTRGIHVVSRVYAATSCDQNPFPVDADHGDIVKPAGTESDIYAWARARIQEASKAARGITRAESPSGGLSRSRATPLPGQRPIDASRGQAQPIRWQDYAGFRYLIGSWRGKAVGGPLVEMEVPFTDAEDVIATISLTGTTCSIAAKIVRGTQMFSASQFYFKPTTIAAGCPDVEYVRVVPVLDSMTWELVVAGGKSIHASLSRRL